MKRKKYRVVAAALCAAFLLCGITTTAYAGGGEEWEDGTGGPEWEGLDPVEPPATPELEPEPNPFTPDGQGTMVDNATDQDGKSQQKNIEQISSDLLWTACQQSIQKSLDCLTPLNSTKRGSNLNPLPKKIFEILFSAFLGNKKAPALLVLK